MTGWATAASVDDRLGEPDQGELYRREVGGGPRPVALQQPRPGAGRRHQPLGGGDAIHTASRIETSLANVRC